MGDWIVLLASFVLGGMTGMVLMAIAYWKDDDDDRRR